MPTPKRQRAGWLLLILGTTTSIGLMYLSVYYGWASTPPSPRQHHYHFVSVVLFWFSIVALIGGLVGLLLLRRRH